MRLVTETLIIDNCALMAYNRNDSQVIVNRFSTAAKLFGLTISLKKTESLFQKSPVMVKMHPYPIFKIDDNGLQNVDSFKYFASIIFSNRSLNIEITDRIN